MPKISRYLTTPQDKYLVTNLVLGANPRREQTIYIGSGMADLICLAAFGGVIIGTAWWTKQTKYLFRAVVSLPHISDWNGELICWAVDFEEVKRYGYIEKRIARAVPSWEDAEGMHGSM